MLFDLRPKNTRSDLFDREVELGRFVEYVGGLGLPITLVLGFRSR